MNQTNHNNQSSDFLMNGQVRVDGSGEKKVGYELEEEMRMAAEPGGSV